ncbi:signal peptidase I, partial [bacterium]|nr:signal peptidase I [bacterium]
MDQNDTGETPATAAQPTPNEEQRPQWSTDRKRWLWENLVSLLTALTVVLIIRSSIIEAFKIPSGSMLPTLLVGDHIFVNKFAYGLKIPFSDLVT